MLAYEQRVRHGGLSFDVRTEHQELGKGQQVTSSLWYQGSMLSERAFVLASDDRLSAGIRLFGMVGRQHRRLVVDLTQGKLDELITKIPGTAEFAALRLREGGNTPVPASAGLEDISSVDRIMLSLLDSAPGDAALEAQHAVDATEAEDLDAALADMGDGGVSGHGTDATAEFDAPQTTAIDLPSDEVHKHSPLADDTAFKGDLDLLSVSDLLQYLAESRRSGTIVLVSECGLGRIHLNRGNIIGVVSTSAPNLSTLLVRRGLVDSAQLARARGAQRGEPGSWSLASSLLRQGTASESDLIRVLADLAIQAMVEFVQWGSGHFTFEPVRRVPHPNGDALIEVNTRGVLLDALRIIDEQTHQTRS